jgi:(1->4)-alpha-D-glucan 1-alpha-D-glucosylmutase
MDQPAVFRDAHAFVGHLLAAGTLQGLRIDHVDGLADPQRYLRRLRAFAATCMPRGEDGSRARPYILVEKILARDESLPRSWPVAGTTGYDYLALANGLFIDATGYAKLQRFFSRFTGLHLDLAQEIYACRRLVVERSFASELTYLANALVDIAEADWFTRDFTRKRLRDALTEIVSGFAVYRTYVTERGASQADRAAIGSAIEAATARWVGTDTEILEFLHALLTLDIATANPSHYEAKKDSILRFIARFQQYTGAIAAKAIEDTLFYRFVPLLSAHEVGSSPVHPAATTDEYHADAAARLAAHPLAMLASATHDTKRGEDTRARIDALSEMPDEWARRVARWHVYNRARLGEAGGSPAPSLRDEYVLYQSIVGTWPMQVSALLRMGEARRAYVARLKAYAVKSSREAKIETSWVAPNLAYEEGYCRFIDAIFENPGDNRFIDSVLRFLPRLRRLGAFNGLAQLVLKATAPGVPDFYQGSEFWDLSLVDPDNRRPVDYQARMAALAAPDFATALARWREGWLKQWITHRLLDLRNRAPELFRNGTYDAVTIAGPAEKSVLAFQRRHRAESIFVIACRLIGDKAPGDLGQFWPGAQFLAQTRLEGVPPGRWIDRLTDRAIVTTESGISLPEALSDLPVAVLGAEANAEGR